MFEAPNVDRAPAPALEVHGEGDCPRAGDVASALGRMLGPAPPGAPADVAELREEGGVFVVVLRRPSGETLGEKRLPATLDCHVRAEAAAVSIAAMEAQLGGDGALPLPVPPEAPPPPPAPPAPAVETVARPAPAPEARAPLAPELGAGVFASRNGDNYAPAARIEVALTGADDSWAFVLAGLAVAPHQIAVSPGTASWWRVGGELALRGAAPLGRGARIEPGVGFALTALAVGGQGFSRNATDVLLDPGAVARLRLVPLAARVRPWLEVSAAYWPRSHVLTVTGVPSREAHVPGLELFVGVGASFGGRR